jgi:hypothetical protein
MVRHDLSTVSQLACMHTLVPSMHGPHDGRQVGPEGPDGPPPPWSMQLNLQAMFANGSPVV